jgi:hypothetical protein
MKKLINILILSFFIISCGSRKKALEKSEEKTEIQQSTDYKLEEKTIVENVSTLDFAQFIDNYGLKVKSKGQNYNLNIGGLVFSGNADIELQSNKEKTNIKTVETQHITYWSQITYKSIYRIKEITRYKTLKVQSTKPSFWFGCFLYLLGFATIPLIKLIIKK